MVGVRFVIGKIGVNGSLLLAARLKAALIALRAPLRPVVLAGF